MEKFDRDNFARVAGSVFVLKSAGDITADLELIEVSELLEQRGQRGFSILFQAPKDCEIQQGLYDLEHPALGTMQLFIVPVGRKDGRLRLEAIFNELIDEG